MRRVSLSLAAVVLLLSAGAAPARASPRSLAPRSFLFDGPIRVIVHDDASGATYLAGDFTKETAFDGRVLARVGGLVALDARGALRTDWAPAPDGAVRALAVAGARLVVGGDFGSIGGRPRSRVAVLDPVTGRATAWRAAPEPVGSVRALAVAGADVYVGGDVHTESGPPRHNLFAYALGTGALTSAAPEPDAPVRALAPSLHDTTLYVGGDFTAIGGQPRDHLARIQGPTGRPTGWAPKLVMGGIDAIAVSPVAVFPVNFGRATPPSGCGCGVDRLDPDTGGPTFPPSSGSPAWFAPPYARSFLGTVDLTGVAVSRRAMFVAGRWGIYSGGIAHIEDDQGVYAFDLVTGETLARLPVDESTVTAMAASGRTAYIGTSQRAAGSSAVINGYQQTTFTPPAPAPAGWAEIDALVGAALDGASRHPPVGRTRSSRLRLTLPLAGTVRIRLRAASVLFARGTLTRRAPGEARIRLVRTPAGDRILRGPSRYWPVTVLVSYATSGRPTATRTVRVNVRL